MRTWLLRALDVLLRRQRDERLSEEIQSHLDLLTDDHIARGMSPAEARLAARRSFGGVDQIKERYRDERGLPFLDMFVQDVRFAFRLMRKNLGFSVTAGGSLALSIGALTMAFSLVNAFVFKPLPIRDPASLFFLQSGSFGWSYPDLRDLRDRLDGDGLAGYRITMMSAGLQPDASILWGYLVTGNYFDLLGLTPAAGRFFKAEEDTQPGAAPYAVIAFDTWRSRFGGRPDAIGSDLTINGRRFTILGVAPRGFHGTEVFYRPEIWVPMSMQAEIEVGSSWLTMRDTQNVMVVARLRPGMAREQGEARLRAVVTQLSGEHVRNSALTVRLTRPGLFGDMIGGPARAFAWGLFALGVLLMLAGCSNLAGLLLARGSDRTREIVLRSALGAGKARIARQLLTESILLALAGGAGGAAIAWAGTRIASAWQLPTELPARLDLTADTTVLLFAAGVALCVGVMVGIAPVRFATRLDLNQALKGHAGFGVGRPRFQGRDVLLAVQVALCVVLLHASLLAVRGLQRASTASLGWNPSGLVMAGTELGLAGYTREQVNAYLQRVLAEARRLPGVVSAATSNSMPLHIDQSSTTVFAVPVTQPERGMGVSVYQVSPGFFSTLDIPFESGRDVNDFDTATTPPVAVVNSVMAARLFPDGNAVGQLFREGRHGPPTQIVGIVEGGKYVSLGESPKGAIFLPLAQRRASSSMLIVRTAAGAGVRPEDLRQLLHRIDPNLPVRSTATGEQLTAFPLLPYRAAVAALGFLGVICSGLLLSGLHAMLAYAVARRQREIGIRVALGAGRSSVVRSVLSRVFVVLGIGVALGVTLAAGTGPLVSSMVLGVSPREPFLLMAIAAGLGLIAVASCAGPVRRSLRIDPLTALRED